MHAGHTANVTDISFNPTIPWTLATTAEDNIVHLWKINENLTSEFDGGKQADDDDLDIRDLE
jgi:histone-binding protein RBBP4